MRRKITETIKYEILKIQIRISKIIVTGHESHLTFHLGKMCQS